MNSFIEYFYNMKISKVEFNNRYYSFVYDKYLYRLYIVAENTNIDYIVLLNKRLLSSTLVSEIIMNVNYKYISTYNDTNYVLIKLFVNPDKKINLYELIYFDNSLYISNNSDWGILWSKKIDYLEKLIGENGKKYPLIVDSFNYFVGMAENAISYFNSIFIPKDYKLFISHHSLDFNLSSSYIYNPLNIFFDYMARDIGEYIKYSFFSNNKKIFNELNTITNNLSIVDVNLIIARIMYPSFYFNLYEDILIYNNDEKILINIIERLDDYQKYLYDIISYFNTNYEVSNIDWLKKD